jgi:hypothetical protein
MPARLRAAVAADCPDPQASRPSTYGRALHAACVLAGGITEFAARLGVSEALVRDWIEGRSHPPEDRFLAAVEIILLDTEKRTGLAS